MYDNAPKPQTAIEGDELKSQLCIKGDRCHKPHHNDTLHNATQHIAALNGRLFTAMLSVIMLSVVMLNVVMISVVMLSVTAPKHRRPDLYFAREFWPADNFGLNF